MFFPTFTRLKVRSGSVSGALNNQFTFLFLKSIFFIIQSINHADQFSVVFKRPFISPNLPAFIKVRLGDSTRGHLGYL